MTDTTCPHCNVLLDLPKYATGACTWCGKHLPAALVAHARERVAQRKVGHQRITTPLDEKTHPTAAVPGSPGMLNARTGLLLALAVMVALAVWRGDQISRDLSQPYIYLVAAACVAVAVGGGALMTRRRARG